MKPNFYEGNIVQSATGSAESAKYECRNCAKLFNRQVRITILWLIFITERKHKSD